MGMAPLLFLGKNISSQRSILILGGSGITSGYSHIARSLLLEGDEATIRVADVNKSEGDILLKEELDGFVERSGGRLKVTHVLSHPSDEWKVKKGHVDSGLLKERSFEPGENVGVFLCGPLGIIQKAALPALRERGFDEGRNVFGFWAISRSLSRSVVRELRVNLCRFVEL